MANSSGDQARRPIVALDGPAGAGKSSIARRLAERLDFILVDTGALYRGVARAAVDAGVSFADGAGLVELLRQTQIQLVYDGPTDARLLIDGKDRTSEIRTPEISDGASQVSAHPGVRDHLLQLQRDLGRRGGVVMEGRDIGTVVFPDAEIKVFLTATPVVRAERRTKQLEEKGQTANLKEVLTQIEERDRRDSGRPVSPLRRADDAFELDTSSMSMDEVVAHLALRVEREFPLKNSIRAQSETD